jgi:integrase
LQSIRYSDLRAYRAARLNEPTRGDVARHKRELELDKRAELRVTRTIASVNRELSKLRRMFSIAEREKWLKKDYNPFRAGESLISLADERKRERILTREEERQVSMQMRLCQVLTALYEQSPKDQVRRVFGILDNVKRSFASARAKAGLSDVRFHDLRHTHATRLVGAHIPLSEVGRVLGHTAEYNLPVRKREH